jgi:hypothetical protein
MTFRQIGTTRERGKGGDDVGENEKRKKILGRKDKFLTFSKSSTFFSK